MGDMTNLEMNLKKRGYAVTRFSRGEDASAYLNAMIDKTTVGIGGSATIKEIQVYDTLKTHNDVYWHWEQEKDEARMSAMNTEYYLTSANAVSESGEIINIDGLGNRVASTLFGHRKIFFVIGRNKLTSTFEEAVWRARNVAAPKRAKQLGHKTPCAIKADKCYDCASPERVCRGLVTLWAPMMGMEAEVILIDEDLGL